MSVPVGGEQGRRVVLLWVEGRGGALSVAVGGGQGGVFVAVGGGQGGALSVAVGGGQGGVLSVAGSGPWRSPFHPGFVELSLLQVKA